MVRTGSDFSGVGAFDQALARLEIQQEKVFACDMDKYARQTYIHNYGEPAYYPENVYDREIPQEPLDIYMTSPPCQAFSLAGKRKGEADKRGILFYNSHEFIQKNKPRFFIFENVKGLLSDDNGRTFNNWCEYLGGKSVNGNPVIFPIDEAVPYHIYWKVLNAKDYGVPQNRERVFIIGIRDDIDNNFSFPKPFHLVKRLKDVLEPEVEEKYFLSDKMINGLTGKNLEDNGFTFKPKNPDNIGNCVTARCFKMGADDNYLKVKSATKSGYEIATEEDSINLEFPDSETRRGRVGKGVAQTLDTWCNQGVMVYGNLVGGKWDKTHEQNGRVYDPEGIGATLHTFGGGNQHPKIIDKVVQLNQSIESGGKQPYKQNRIYDADFLSPALDTECGRPGYLTQNQQDKFQNLKVNTDVSGCLTEAIGRGGSSDEYMSMVKRNAILTHKIRRLTPRECFRLMDFPDTFSWPVSDSQAYKQAGNSIVVNVLSEIIKKLAL